MLQSHTKLNWQLITVVVQFYHSSLDKPGLLYREQKNLSKYLTRTDTSVLDHMILCTLLYQNTK